MEYSLTWKPHTTPAGRSIYRLRALARPTSASASTGWPTVRANDWQQDSPGCTSIRGKLNHMVPRWLAGWSTPSSRDWKDTPGMAVTATNPDGSPRLRLDQLPRQALLAGWPTCQVCQGPNMSRNRGRDHGAARDRVTPQSVEAIMAGVTPPSSPAATESTAAPRLNPLFSLWLMGFPARAWASSAEQATPSSRPSRRSSSRPS